MLFDFGLDPRHFDDDEMVRRKIEEIDDTFDMVLIAGRFEESIVLLKAGIARFRSKFKCHLTDTPRTVYGTFNLQGDHSGCSLGFVDIITNVAF